MAFSFNVKKKKTHKKKKKKKKKKHQAAFGVISLKFVSQSIISEDGITIFNRIFMCFCIKSSIGTPGEVS